MKHVTVILLATALVFYLCGCGPSGIGADTPSDNQVQQDIENALLEKYTSAKVKKVETIKSLTEDTHYEITASVLAETAYADWVYECELTYTKYDQGWMKDTCSWISGSYTVARKPDTETMTAYVEDALSIHEKYSDAWYADYLLPIANAEMQYGENDTILLNWDGIEYLRHGQCVHRFSSIWEYNCEIDNWELAPDEENPGDYLLTHDRQTPTPDTSLDFTGTWKYESKAGGYHFLWNIEIQNFTWEGFDARLVEQSDSLKHFTLADTAPSQFAYSNLIFASEDGEYITFNFGEDRTGITYVFQNLTSLSVEVKNSLPYLS